MTDTFDIKIPSLRPEDEFTFIDGQKVKVVRPGEMKDEPEPSIHHHNNLDQPAIDLTREVIGSIQHSDLSGVTSDQHHAQLHAASHTSGGADDLVGVVLSSPTVNSGTLVSPVIGTPAITGGTATSITLVTPTVGTPTVTGGTLTNSTFVTPTIGTPTVTGGTANSLTLGTPTITGGTATSIVTVTPTIGTMSATGGTATNLTLVTPTIGTPSLTGGTANMNKYLINGTAGASGTVVYVKTVDFGGSTVTTGTMEFNSGLATLIS